VIVIVVRFRFVACTLYSIGKQTSKVGELMWFFNVGLSGKNGQLNGKWEVKTLQTLLKENNHLNVMLPIIAR